MNRNSTNFFAQEATIDIPRAKWETNHNHKTTFNNGWLVPFFVDTDIIPGMTIKNKTAVLIRMSTPKYPVMDNLFLDTYYFKIPIWTIWPTFKQFMGENEDGAWANTVDYQIPMFKTTSTQKVTVNDTNCYMGIPLGIAGLSFNQFGVRALIRTYNFWFRDQNLIAPVKYNDGDDDIELDGTIKTGCGVLKVAKFHDYFTSLLPQPQKGDAVSLPIGTKAPVYGEENVAAKIKMNTTEGTWASTANLGGVGWGFMGVPSTQAQKVNIINKGAASETTVYADLSAAVSATINAQRLAFATQRILEKEARFGTRYNEIIRGQFGVSSPNASLHVPEYLGGNRIPINIETVLQNSNTTTESPLGQTGAFSVSFDVNDDFTKSFDEHCVLLGVCCVRAEHTYQEGLARMWTRRRKLDYYTPSLAHIGNQPVYNYEIYAQGTAVDNEVFGYKEAWAEYKYKPDRISGELLSTYAQSLDAWHYGDDYSSLPVLSQNFIEEPTEFVDRTLLVQAAQANQFIADFEIHQEVAAPIPLHCTPGLIDHY
nr:MAG TPA: Major capsid protein [Microviridae sp.]